MPVDVVAIVTPVPGKEARVEEILKELISKVEQNEPDVARYIAYKSQNAEGATEYVFTERYVPAPISFDPSKDNAKTLALTRFFPIKGTRTRQHSRHIWARNISMRLARNSERRVWWLRA